MKKVLIPVDFSKPSEYASKLGSKIARGSNSEVHILHMIELPKGVIDMTSSSSFSIPQNMLYIKKTKEKMNSHQKEFFFKKQKRSTSYTF